MKLVVFLLGTRNVEKIRELRPIFSGLGIGVTDPHTLELRETRREAALEHYETFEENALAKARYFHELSGGVPTIADDSGLVVDALDGRPGVKSKRWTERLDLQGRALDDANNAKLIRELTAVQQRGRGRVGSSTFPFPARYVCVAAFCHAGIEIVRRGETTGAIVNVPQGSGGFGYDPYFESEAVGGTFGQATIEQKGRVSHRGRAFRALIDALRERGLV